MRKWIFGKTGKVGRQAAILAGAALGWALAGPALACSLVLPAGADRVLPAQASPDAALVDAAVLAEVNFRRCRAGLAPLRASAGLRAAAAQHSAWMARRATITHSGGAAGQQSLPARLAAAGMGGRGGAENLAMVHLYQLEGRPVFVRSAASCAFADTAGRPIGRHSHASLAEHLVAQWMASPGHRANLMDPRLAHVGTAAVTAPGGRSCGQVYATQIFAR